MGTETLAEKADKARLRAIEAKTRMWELLGSVLAGIALLLTLPAIIVAAGLVKLAWDFFQKAAWQ